MKLIALRNFRNTHGIDLDGDGKLTQHEKHVHKGATFAIGGAKEFKDLSKADQRIVLELNHAKCVGDATDEKLVKRIAAEVAEDARAEKRARETTAAAGSNADLVKQLTEALVALTGKKSPA
jgi:hypothetical protein